MSIEEQIARRAETFAQVCYLHDMGAVQSIRTKRVSAVRGPEMGKNDLTPLYVVDEMGDANADIEDLKGDF